MSRAFITRTFIVGALVAATACSHSESSTGPQPADHVLVQVDPKPIPFVIDNGPFYGQAGGMGRYGGCPPTGVTVSRTRASSCARSFLLYPASANPR